MAGYESGRKSLLSSTNKLVRPALIRLCLIIAFSTGKNGLLVEVKVLLRRRSRGHDKKKGRSIHQKDAFSGPKGGFQTQPGQRPSHQV